MEQEETALMRMLCTIVQPSEGQILWNSKNMETEVNTEKFWDIYHRILGCAPDLTVYDYMMYISSIKGKKNTVCQKKSEAIIKSSRNGKSV